LVSDAHARAVIVIKGVPCAPFHVKPRVPDDGEAGKWGSPTNFFVQLAQLVAADQTVVIGLQAISIILLTAGLGERVDEVDQ
jgi:hypothetical protein